MDPYAFPSDDDNSPGYNATQSKDNRLFAKSQFRMTGIPVTQANTATVSAPVTEADAEPDRSSIKQSASPRVKWEVVDKQTDIQAMQPQSNTETVDTIMGGTEASEAPSANGEHTSSGQQGFDQTGHKRAAPRDTVILPIPLPSNVKLRPPQKLKRLREAHEKRLAEMEVRVQPKKAPSADEQARAGLRRALVLALDHVGFTSATSDALESFLLMTETYLQSLVEDVSRFALAAHRTQPIPLDFDASLARFNLGTAALRPHLRNPVPAAKRTPTYVDPTAIQLSGIGDPELLQQLRLDLLRAGDANCDLPLLSRELSGKADKDTKAYIPSGFPDFPSIHTYRHTPVDVDTITVRGNGLRYADDGSPVLLSDEEEDEEADVDVSNRGPGGLIRRDPKRIREAAAVEAKQAEEALRSLLRASKVHKLKEVRAASSRNQMNKQRYALWETAMRELIQDGKGGSGGGALLSQPNATANAPLASLREEIADQSMMVNAEKVFHRREIPRKVRKAVHQKG